MSKTQSPPTQGHETMINTRKMHIQMFDSQCTGMLGRVQTESQEIEGEINGIPMNSVS